MIIRTYLPSDCEEMATLFYQTVHTVVAVEEDRVVTHASITAKGFFEHRGYRLEKEQQVVRNGVSLTNYRRVKETAGSQGTKVKEEDL